MQNWIISTQWFSNEQGKLKVDMFACLCIGFLEPFQWDLWMGVLASFLVCGIAVTYCSYVSPFGFYGRYAQRLDVNDHRYKEQSKVLNVIDNLWYTYASWQTQVRG